MARYRRRQGACANAARRLERPWLCNRSDVMVALLVVFIFLGAIVALNIFEFGRPD